LWQNALRGDQPILQPRVRYAPILLKNSAGGFRAQCPIAPAGKSVPMIQVSRSR
jgi:hypothetical protein